VKTIGRSASPCVAEGSSAPLSQPGDCAESIAGGGGNALASRTEKVQRAELQDVPKRRKKYTRRSGGSKLTG